MEEFLRKRDVNVDKMKEENIDVDIVPMMNDAELANYIPKFGDRVALRNFLQSSVTPSTGETQQKKTGLMEKLRKKLKNSTSSEEQSKAESDSLTKIKRSSNARKEKIRIELGWMHFNDKQNNYTQVRARCGGGTRHVRLYKSATKMDIMKEAKAVFFPGGRSPKGQIKHMKCELSDFKLDIVDKDITIENIISDSKMYKVRFYLTTKPGTEFEGSDEELPILTARHKKSARNQIINQNLTDVTSQINQHKLAAVNTVPNPRTVDAQILKNVPLDRRNTPSKQTVPIVLSNQQVSAVCEPIQHTTTTLGMDRASEQLGQSITWSAEQITFRESNTSIATESNQAPIEYGVFMIDKEDNTLFEDVLDLNPMSESMDTDITSIVTDDAIVRAINEWSDGEVQFGPGVNIDAHVPLDDTIPLERNEPVQSLHCHRGHVLEDLVQAASQDAFNTNVKYELKMIGANGEAELAEDNGGVFRDALTEFWDTFYMKYCLGTTAKVPVIRHDMSASMWMAISKIVVIGWNQENIFPVQLAKPFIQQCLYGCVDQKCDLVASFLEYLPSMDKSVVNQALSDFTADEEDLLDLFERLKVKQRVSRENIQRILQEVSHRELVQAPMFICDSWHRTMNQLQIDPEQLDELYRQLVPTNRKVLKALSFPEQLSKPEMELRDYLNDLIRELEPEMLKLFLRFCTGSDMMVKTNITVRFTSSDLSDNVRCPTSHTCGCILEIPRTYSRDSYVVFKSDFKSVLQSRYWRMDVV